MTRVLAIVGATATGKSALAMELAERLDGEIINADALQVYRGFDIGTAKPSLEERRRVPHHLIDVLDPDEPYSAGEFARRARSAIAEIQARGRRALVVGGSGFYQRALFRGLPAVPDVDPELRRRLQERCESEGLESLRRELEKRDPETAARLAAGDTQRILRALEVLEETGRPLSWWQSQPAEAPPLSALRVGLTLPRAILYDRILSRIRRMITEGWVEEVVSLLERWPDPDLPAFQAIGYRQLARFVGGESSLETAIEEIDKETRRYAKRQTTWFRRELDIRWFSAESVRDELPLILELFCPVP